MWDLFHILLPIPQNTIMTLNNVMIETTYIEVFLIHVEAFNVTNLFGQS